MLRATLITAALVLGWVVNVVCGLAPPASLPSSPPPRERRLLPVAAQLVEPRVQPPAQHSRRSFWTSATTAAVATTVLVTGSPQFQSPAVAAATSTITSTSSTVAVEQQTTVVGAKAPTFDLPNSRGTGNTSLAQLIASKNKWTVLYFYPGAFTPGCTLEARAFQRDIDQYRQLSAQIVGVSVDPPEKNAQFCSAEGLDFYLLSDTGTYTCVYMYMWRVRVCMFVLVRVSIPHGATWKANEDAF
jgi:peroxiredoxin